MSISHPIRSLGELEGEVSKREIVKTDHFLNDSIPDRPNLDASTVADFVENKWDEALEMAYKGKNKIGHRYNVVFDKSNKYFLIVGIDIRDYNVDIVTAFQTNKHRGQPDDLARRWG